MMEGYGREWTAGMMSTNCNRAFASRSALVCFLPSPSPSGIAINGHDADAF